MQEWRTNVIRARVSTSEKRAILAAAKRRNLTVSELIRDACNYAAGPPQLSRNPHQPALQ